MLNFFKEVMNGFQTDNPASGTGQNIDEKTRVQIATCALFLEMANSDEEFSKEEKKLIFDIMAERFHLDDEHVKELIDLSEAQRQKSVSLYEFTHVINEQFSKEQKTDVLKNLWRLIYVDEKLDQYEEYFIRKINNNFNLSHSDLIATKMEVKAELGLS